jgi:uncharacterized membrane protein HdeD (DUF308 family)
MSSIVQKQAGDTLNELASGVRAYSGWFIALGVLQILAGIVALTSSFSATIASMAILGSILVVGSGAQLETRTMQTARTS